MRKAHEALPRAPVLVEAAPERRGFVAGVDARAIGLAVVALGGGRTRASDSIDPAVGLTELAPIGAEVGAGSPAGACACAKRRCGRGRRRGAFAPPIASPTRRPIAPIR